MDARVKSAFSRVFDALLPGHDKMRCVERPWAEFAAARKRIVCDQTLTFSSSTTRVTAGRLSMRSLNAV
jgi:hypothetical protein